MKASKGCLNDLYRAQLMAGALALCGLVSTATVLADGMVVPQVFYPKVEIPNQQALIHFSNGMERLVIETSFLGEGTNFAWVVPLPSAPEVKPVSETFFTGLQQAFQPRLTHRVRPYFAGVLLLCGWTFLGWRSLRDEVSWVVDLPLCLLLSAGAGVMGRGVFFALLAGGLTLCLRLFSRTPASLALLLLIGTGFDALLIFPPFSMGLGLIQTLGGSDPGTKAEAVAGVSVLFVQRAGVFDATTIRGEHPRAVLEWLVKNGYETPKSAEPAIRHYVEEGWVFVASKVRCGDADSKHTALHPLVFTFAARAPVYPTRLTAINNGACAIDLYVFGQHRATARHFGALRCDYVASSLRPAPKSSRSALGISDPEVLAMIGDSPVGTKLSARLSPGQMASDVNLHSTWFWSKGAAVYSYSGALMIALNVALPLAALSWLLIGASRGGWNVGEKWISRWRWRLLAVAVGVGLAVFVSLPKVEIVTRSGFPQGGLEFNAVCGRVVARATPVDREMNLPALGSRQRTSALENSRRLTAPAGNLGWSGIKRGTWRNSRWRGELVPGSVLKWDTKAG